MAKDIFHLLSSALAHYGYAAIALILLLENLGLPLPGETVLLLAGFLAASQNRFTLSAIIVIGVLSTSIGSCLGYLAGCHGGRPLLDRYQRGLHLSPAALQKGEDLFARYGPATIFLARFVAGLRILAGPLAGVLRMPWRIFLLFNILGSILWVTAISCAAYFFGQHWNRLLKLMGNLNIVLLLVALTIAGLFWWRHRKEAALANTKSS